MTDDQITALAREYAEWICPYKDKSANLSILDIREAERLIHFLLRRYCLVEKSKVEEVYKNTKSYKSELEPFSRQSDCCSVKLRLLESLFPEIAKEVENEAS